MIWMKRVRLSLCFKKKGRFDFLAKGDLLYEETLKWVLDGRRHKSQSVEDGVWTQERWENEKLREKELDKRQKLFYLWKHKVKRLKMKDFALKDLKSFLIKKKKTKEKKKLANCGNRRRKVKDNSKQRTIAISYFDLTETKPNQTHNFLCLCLFIVLFKKNIL